MKHRKLVLIVLFFSTLQTAFAGDEWRFGLKASPTLAWLKPDTKEIENNGAKLTFSWGFLAEYQFQENYSIASGVELTSRGGKFTILDTTDFDYRLKYIDLPITIKMRTKEIGYFRYFGQFGFTPGINISAKYDIDYKSTNDDKDIDAKESVALFNLGLYIGLGTEYSLGGNTALTISAAFNNGFLDIIEGGSKAVANYASLNVGVLF